MELNRIINIFFKTTFIHEKEPVSKDIGSYGLFLTGILRVFNMGKPEKYLVSSIKIKDTSIKTDLQHS